MKKPVMAFPIERETELRGIIEEAGRRHRAAFDAEIAPYAKELAGMMSMRPIMVTSESGYSYIYRPGALP